MSLAEVKKLESICNSTSNLMSGLSIGLLVLNLFLAMGLKYLWNLMNLLQFLIFMQMWQVKLPDFTRIIFKELKSLAFLEFLPTGFFKEALKKLLEKGDG